MSCTPEQKTATPTVTTNDPTFVAPEFRGGALSIRESPASFASVSGTGTMYGITEFADVSEMPRKYLTAFGNQRAIQRTAPGSARQQGFRTNAYSRLLFNTAGAKTSQMAYAEWATNIGADVIQLSYVNDPPPAGWPWQVLPGNFSSAGGTTLDTFEAYVQPSFPAGGWTVFPWVKGKRTKRLDVSAITLDPNEQANSPSGTFQSQNIGSAVSPQRRSQIRAFPVWQGDGMWRWFGFWQMQQPGVGAGPLTTLKLKITPGDVFDDDFTDALTLGQLQAGPGGGFVLRWFAFTVPAGVSLRFRLEIDAETPGEFPERLGAEGVQEEAGFDPWFYMPADPNDFEFDYVEHLGSEDRLEDALRRGTFTEGMEKTARTIALSGGLTAESYVPIDVECTTVRMTQAFQCLTAGKTYRIQVTMQRQAIGGGSESTVYQYHDFDALAENQVVAFDILQPPVGFEQTPVALTASIVGDVPVPATGFANTETYVYQGNIYEAGGEITLAQLEIADGFLTELRASGLLTRIPYLLPILGNDVAAAMQPLVDRLLVGPFQSTAFVDGDVSQALGITGDGATKRLTGPFNFNRLDGAATGRGGMGLWLTSWNNLRHDHMTQRAAGPNDNRYGFIIRDAASTAEFSWGLIANRALGGSTSLGHYFGHRYSDVSRRVFKDGLFLANNTTSDPAQNVNIAPPSLFAARSTADAYSSFLNGSIGFAYFTSNDGVNDAEAAILHALILENFMQPLGRA